MALNRLANVHYQRQENEAAHALFARALALREAVLPADAPELRLSVNNLANCCRNLGRFAEAEVLYRRVLDHQEKHAEAEAFAERLRRHEAA